MLVLSNIPASSHWTCHRLANENKQISWTPEPEIKCFQLAKHAESCRHAACHHMLWSRHERAMPKHVYQSMIIMKSQTSSLHKSLCGILPLYSNLAQRSPDCAHTLVLCVLKCSQIAGAVHNGKHIECMMLHSLLTVQWCGMPHVASYSCLRRLTHAHTRCVVYILAVWCCLCPKPLNQQDGHKNT